MNRLQEKLWKWKSALEKFALRIGKIRFANFCKQKIAGQFFPIFASKFSSRENFLLILIFLALALALSVPSSAVKPSSSSGTFEAWVNASSWGAANQTIFSAPSEGSTGSAGLVGNAKTEDFWIYEKSGGFPIYWRFNNDSDVGEGYGNPGEIGDPTQETGLILYMRFNNDSAVGEDYNATNAS